MLFITCSTLCRARADSRDGRICPRGIFDGAKVIRGGRLGIWNKRW